MKVLLVTVRTGARITGGNLYDLKIVEALRAKGVAVETLELPRLPYALAPLQALDGRLRRALEGPARPDAVVVDGLAHPAAATAMRLRRRPGRGAPAVITLVHMLKSREEPATLVRPLAACLERALLRASDLVVTNSQASRRDIARLAGAGVDVAVCPPGCDVVAPPRGAASRAAAPRAAGPPLVLAVGNLFRVKGQDLLVRALSAHTEVEWRLRLVGDATVDPRFTRRVLRLVRRHGLGRRVELAGPLSGEALAAAYRDADLFVISSRYEAYGIALAEAISFGLPFVAFDVGGVSEAGGCEGLVPAGDVRGLGASIAAMLASPERRAAAALRSHERAALLPTWAQTAECFALRLFELAAARRAG